MPPSAGVSDRRPARCWPLLVAESGSTALSSGLSLAAGGQLHSRSRRELEQERRTGGEHGAGGVSRTQRRHYTLFRADDVHTLNETDGSLNLANLALTASVKRALANDVTVCGENEPVAYVTEYFLGDGVTTEFDLAQDPYFPATSKSTIVHELFNEAQINQSLWGVTGGGAILTLGANGLAMNGGNGIDGQTLLSWLEPVEMGGTLLLELVGVTLSPGSTGILAVSYRLDTAAGCTAGFQVTARRARGVTLQPMVKARPPAPPLR